MRYSVFFKKAGGEKVCVYNTTSPDLMLALMNPKVHLAADSAGSFECALNPMSPAMSDKVLERMATKVMIEEYEDHVPNDHEIDSANGEKVLFYGRVLSIDKDFYNTPSLYCEGAWSFLNDTVIMPYIMPKKNNDQTYFTPKQALIKFLSEHNIAVDHQADVCIKFETNPQNMIVTMKDDLFSGEKNDGSGEEIDNFKILTYTNTLEVFNQLKKTYGGHFRVRYRKALPEDRAQYGNQMAIPIVDWIADYNNSEEGEALQDAETYIQFGENLLDLTQKTDGSNIVNCLFLTGKKIHSAEIETIGDEIDIAPMTYYWMARINDDDSISVVTNDQNEPVSPTNIHDMRFFSYVKEGALYRNPVSLSELSGLHDYDISHIYHIASGTDAGWWAWDPRLNGGNGAYRKFGTPNTYSGERSIRDSDLINGNAIWVRQDYPGLGNDPSGSPYNAVTSSRIEHDWVASSRGLGWIDGAHIKSVGGETLIEYSYAFHEYSCTGFWNGSIGSGQTQVPVGTPIPTVDPEGAPIADPTAYWNAGYKRAWDYGSLVVSPEEKFFITQFYAATSDDKVVGQIVTKNYLKTGSATIVKSDIGSEGGKTSSYSGITMPTPEENNDLMYLNISGKDKVSGGSQLRPQTRAELGMQLWRARKTQFDEYITMYGLQDGGVKWYLASEKYTEATTGKERTRTVLKEPKRVPQLMVGTPDDEQWFVYPPKAEDWFEVAYENSDAFPEDFNDLVAAFPDDAYWTDPTNHTGLKVFFIAKDNGYVWQWKSDNSYYECINPLSARAYKVNSYGVEDPVSIAKYGRIEKIINFSSCSDPVTLRDLGAKKLFEAKLEGLEINVTALDLSLLKHNVKSPDVLDMISIRSRPHRIGEYSSDGSLIADFSLPLSSRDIPLNDPSQQQYTIGYTGSQKITKTYDWVKR